MRKAWLVTAAAVWATAFLTACSAWLPGGNQPQSDRDPSVAAAALRPVARDLVVSAIAAADDVLTGAAVAKGKVRELISDSNVVAIHGESGRDSYERLKVSLAALGVQAVIHEVPGPAPAAFRVKPVVVYGDGTRDAGKRMLSAPIAPACVEIWQWTGRHEDRDGGGTAPGAKQTNPAAIPDNRPSRRLGTGKPGRL